MHGKFSFLFKNQLGIVEEEEREVERGDGVLFSLSLEACLSRLPYSLYLDIKLLIKRVL